MSDYIRVKKVEGEWQAVYYRNGRRDESRTYFASDKADAISSARALAAETGAEVKGIGSLEAAQVGDLARELGFNESQAAGLFRWYEYPGARYVREQQLPAYVRVQFYEPSSELQVWVVRVRRGEVEEVFTDNVASEAEVVEALRSAASLRQLVAIEELVRWQDDRLEGARGLVEAAASPRKEERHSAERVLADWLLDRGVAF